MSDLKMRYKKVDYTLDSLLNYIELGDIGLPDIQRPFVWDNTRVRDLFDSMYRGFPIGYLLLWENKFNNNSNQIGTGPKQHYPRLLVIDGQQRLTSLYSVLKGREILNKNYRKSKIEIAFNPLLSKFDVSDAAIKKDPYWIHNISEIWISGKSSHTEVSKYLAKLSKKVDLSDENKEIISFNIDKLYDLQNYPFTVLEIAPDVYEEEVADIFVRINSQGVKLNQADFILTLMSVFWDEGRKNLELFCRDSIKPADDGKPSPYNYFIEPQPDNLLRVAVALGFMRGQLRRVYNLLRGRDIMTGEFNDEIRENQFNILKDAQNKVLNLSHWHEFLKCILDAGYRKRDMITSKNTLLFAYALFLIGKTKYNVFSYDLRKIIARWYFSSHISNRYIFSPESKFERDLNIFKDSLEKSQKPDDFLKILNELIDNEITNDFWEISLPGTLDSQSTQNPAFNAYIAAQVKLKSPVLFSDFLISDLLDPTINSIKKNIEKHHLFPKSFLEKQGIYDLKKINQIANYAYIEWSDNISLGNKPPYEYVPILKERFSKDEWDRFHCLHALPEGWENMDYESFLEIRRRLMSFIIKRGYEQI